MEELFKKYTVEKCKQQIFFEMKLKQIFLFFIFILISSLSFGQDVHKVHKKLELGLNTFSYRENIVSRFGIDSKVGRAISGIYMKLHLKKLQLRGGYDYFQHHYKYVLTEEIVIFDSDEGLDAKYKQNKFYIGIEKDILKTKLRPYAFADVGFYFSKYKGDKRGFPGWISYHFDLNSFAVSFMLGLGIKCNLTKNLILNYEAGFESGSIKTLNDDPNHVFPNSIFGYNPINVLGISFMIH